jgi:hypothetical protein
MDALPIEALYNIICNLPLNYMFTINKQFNQLYTEHYYKHHLCNKYHTLNLRVKTTYKDLCCDSLKEGTLTFRRKGLPEKKLDISGVKAVRCSNFNSLHLVLRFNNDLYVYSDETGEISLIEENITDFDANTYIKGNKLYYLYDVDDWPCKTRLVKGIDEKFKYVVSWGELVFAATDNKWYIFGIKTKTVLEYPINNSASSITGLNVAGIASVSVLLSDGSLLLFSENTMLSDMVLVGILHNVETVHGSIIKVAGKYHSCRRKFLRPHDHDENLFSQIHSGVVSYPLNKNIIGCINCDVCYFLTEDGLYSIDDANNIKRCHKNTKEKKIKRITGNWNGCYEFY